jgi:hypothetical protein
MTVGKDEAPPASPAAIPAQAPDDGGTNAIGAWSQREFVFLEREEKGELTFKYIRNDGQTDNLIWCAMYWHCSHQRR